MFLKHEFKVGFFRWVGPIFLGLLWDIKIFFEIQRFWQQNCREWRRKNYFSFFGHWILWFFLSFMIWRKKRKIFFLIWLIKCPYFFVVIADDKFEMIVGRTFLIFFGPLFHKFFIRKFSIGFICKKTIEFTYYITY